MELLPYILLGIITIIIASDRRSEVTICESDSVRYCVAVR